MRSTFKRRGDDPQALLAALQNVLARCGMSYNVLERNGRALSEQVAPWRCEQMVNALEEIEAALSSAPPSIQRRRSRFIDKLTGASKPPSDESRQYTEAAAELIQAVRFEAEDLAAAAAAIGSCERRMLLEMNVDALPLKSLVEQATQFSDRAWDALRLSELDADQAHSVAKRLEQLTAIRSRIGRLADVTLAYTRCAMEAAAGRPQVLAKISAAMIDTDASVSALRDRTETEAAMSARAAGALESARLACMEQGKREAALGETARRMSSLLGT